MLSRVFVYGTLKAREPNHSWLSNPENGLANLLGRGKTVEKYPLVIASRYNIPFLLDHPGQGHNITGEVYEVDQKMLSQLDVLEDYPRLYDRKTVGVQLLQESGLPSTTSQILNDCWIYVLKKAKAELMNLPFHEEYSSSGAHGLRYAASEDDLTDPNEI